MFLRDYFLVVWKPISHPVIGSWEMRKWQLSDKICEVHLTSVCILFLSLMLAAFLFSIKDFIRAGLPLRALLVVLSLVESVVTTSVSPAPSMEASMKSSSPKSSSNADKKASAGTSAQSWRSKELNQYKHKPRKEMNHFIWSQSNQGKILYTH